MSRHASRKPVGARFAAFDWDRHGYACRSLLNDAYASGGGDIQDYASWRVALEADAEFDPACCFVIVPEAEDAVLGFAQCWNTGFVKDIAVRADKRGQGLGRALMEAVFAHFAAQGFETVWLKVDSNNPSGAGAFYQALGMQERSAR